ncbi:MAG: ribosomal RNA small subunit methyltransferase A [Elusimicrobia bacterium GWA2_56_46]|nr:MAG: ribosomal RNA small subunit methyltransferase A [Elusimicrobia bacterium GWA2_56_46]OGR55715.1 MAG: ribosomal RNA small subunit methyltransferase A [Elusimicrobia bacterium GWC2_56_31]HBB67062.1 ribosomal RNA small subunit methyltransferase A [Elusimicrobiota bacterium]HBW23191.1 ribosomal RNA small subunit methyltransferase A [Elusimicrobiota bacterium]
MPKYSQVFLKDVRMCERIASVLRPEDFCSVVEIGPGRGALTEFLYPLWGDKLSVVEIDPLMTARVKERFPELKIVNSDFLKSDLETAFSEGKIAFIGNLPYDCSTAILMKVLAFSRLGAAVFMFQREVARKITAETGDSDYGYLSVAVQAQSAVSLLADVPAGSFSPVPEVDSSVLVFRPRAAFAGAGHREEFLGFVKNAFSHRRKTLMNSLSMGRGMDKAETAALIKAAGFDPGLRPQNLSVEDYLKLFAAFG